MGSRGPTKRYPARLTVAVDAPTKAWLADRAELAEASVAAVVRELLDRAKEKNAWATERSN